MLCALLNAGYPHIPILNSIRIWVWDAVGCRRAKRALDVCHFYRRRFNDAIVKLFEPENLLNDLFNDSAVLIILQVIVRLSIESHMDSRSYRPQTASDIPHALDFDRMRVRAVWWQSALSGSTQNKAKQYSPVWWFCLLMMLNHLLNVCDSGPGAGPRVGRIQFNSTQTCILEIFGFIL